MELLITKTFPIKRPKGLGFRASDVKGLRFSGSAPNRIVVNVSHVEGDVTMKINTQTLKSKP